MGRRLSRRLFALRAAVVCQPLESRLQFSGGYVDPTFGAAAGSTPFAAGHVVVPDVGPTVSTLNGFDNAPYVDSRPQVLRQPGGKFIVMMTRGITYGDNSVLMTRYFDNGTRDDSFGIDGNVRFKLFPYGDTSNSSTGLAIFGTPGGGFTLLSEFDAYGNGAERYLTKYTTDGALISTTDVPVLNHAQHPTFDTSVAPDGSVWALSTTDGSQGVDTTLYHLKASGDVDKTFGNNGVVFFPPSVIPFSAAQHVFARRNGAGVLLYGSGGAVALTSAGAIDTSFGTNGFVAGTAGQFSAVTLDPLTSDYLAVQVGTTADPHIGVKRISVDGKTVSLFSNAPFDSTMSSAYAGGINADASGNVYVALVLHGANNREQAAVLRLKADGTPDDSFGVHGVALDRTTQRIGTAAVDINSSGGKIEFRPDGTVLLISSVSTRYNDTTTIAYRVGITAFVAESAIDAHSAATPSGVDEGSAITLSVAPVLPPGVTVVGYEWDSNDADAFFQSEGSTAMFTTLADYHRDVRPAVRLTLSNGIILTQAAPIVVRNIVPTIVPLSPVNTLRNLSANLPLRVTDPGDPSVKVDLNWGDGGNTLNFAFATNSSSTNLLHTYSTSGNYLITGTVSDDQASVPIALDTHVFDVRVRAYVDTNGDGLYTVADGTTNAAATVVVDLNQNGIADAGEPVSSFIGGTALLGQGLPLGTVRLLITTSDGRHVVGGPTRSVTLTPSTGGDLSIVLTTAKTITPAFFYDADSNGVRGASEGYLFSAYPDLDNDNHFDSDEPTSVTSSYYGSGVQVIIPKVPNGNYTLRALVTDAFRRELSPTLLPQLLTIASVIVTVDDAGASVAAPTPIAPLKGIARALAFNDLNGDGVMQSNEPILSRVLIHEDRISLGQFDAGYEAFQTLSGINSYLFGLTPGSVTLRAQTPSGFVATTPTSISTTAFASTPSTINYFGFKGADTAAPQVVAAYLDTSVRPARIVVKFSEDVRSVPASDGFINVEVTTPSNQNLAPAVDFVNAMRRQYDPASYTAYVDLSPADLSVDGFFMVTMKSTNYTDVSGVAGQAFTAKLGYLRGDIDGNGVVNFDDLIILAQNYNTTGKTFAQSNIDYDPFGSVNFDDLIVLAQQYNKNRPVAAQMVLDSPPASVRNRQRSSVASDVLGG